MSKTIITTTPQAAQNGDGLCSSCDPDLSGYLHHIAHLDMPLDYKIELLRVVQDIMRSFVDRAFGDDPVQLARKDGDEIQMGDEGDSSPMVALDDHSNRGDEALSGAFAQCADKADRKEKR